MATAAECTAMRQAIALSALGLGTTSPNPPVGCVILDRHGQVAGAGYHARKGEAHAEVHALTMAGPRARGGTALVTLEPCNHVGVTPACRQELLDARVARVVIAVLDPTSRGEGGAHALTAAGIEVEVGVLAEEALHVLQPWLTATRQHQPVITWALSLHEEPPAAPVDDTIEDLRGGFDLVLHDGRLQEGVPAGHGPDAFRLPHLPVPDVDVRPFLTAAYDTGTRTLLLAGDSPLARTLLDHEAIDRIIFTIPRTTPARAAGSLLDAALTHNYTLDRATPTGSSIVIEARRRPPRLRP